MISLVSGNGYFLTRQNILYFLEQPFFNQRLEATPFFETPLWNDYPARIDGIQKELLKSLRRQGTSLSSL